MPDALKPNPSAGWYSDADDVEVERYWDGLRWTDARRPLAAGPVQSVQAASGLDVAALVLAILVGPVGLILGLMSVRRARKIGAKPTGLAIAATIIGGIASAIGLISAIMAAISMSAALSALSGLTSTSVDSSGTETSAEGSDQVADDLAGYCAASITAEPSLAFLATWDVPYLVPSNRVEYTSALSVAFEDAFTAAESLAPYTDEDTEYSVSELISSAEYVRPELSDIINGGGSPGYVNVDTAVFAAGQIVSQAQDACR